MVYGFTDANGEIYGTIVWLLRLHGHLLVCNSCCSLANGWQNAIGRKTIQSYQWSYVWNLDKYIERSHPLCIMGEIVWQLWDLLHRSLAEDQLGDLIGWIQIYYEHDKGPYCKTYLTFYILYFLVCSWLRWSGNFCCNKNVDI